MRTVTAAGLPLTAKPSRFTHGGEGRASTHAQCVERARLAPEQIAGKLIEQDEERQGGIPNGGCAMRPSSNLRESNPFSEWTISADDADARIARAIRICVGDYVREMYSEVLKEPIPPRIAKLLRRLDRKGVQSERG